MEAVLHYEAVYIPSKLIDGGFGGETPEDIYESRYAMVYINGNLAGKVLSEMGDFRALGDSPEDQEAKKMGATIRCDVRGEENLHLVTSGITIKEIDAGWEELYDQAPEDVKRIKAARKDAERRREVGEARKALALVDRTMKVFKGHLPTTEEVRKWRRAYNNLHNEGGEGYIPEVVTAGKVEWAKEVLAEAGTPTSR
jgi:hypothetical protein